MGKRTHGSGDIHKRPDGRWEARLDLGLVNGKRKRKSYYGSTRKEVADKLKDAKVELSKGTNITLERQTVTQFLKTWLDYKESRLAPRTYESYRYICNSYLIPHLGAYQLAKLAPTNIDAMLRTLLNEGYEDGVDRHREQFSSRTLQYIRLILSRALNQAMVWELVTRNVADLVEDIIPHKRTKIVPLTLEQAQKLLTTLKGHRLEALYRVALGLGMRRGEILALKWENIDWKQKILRIEASLQRQNGHLAFGAPKTEESRRIIPVPDVLLGILREHLKRQEKEREETEGWKENGLVFPSNRGTPMEPRNLLRGFKSILRRAGLPETIRFHDLRHSAATFMLALGAALPVISKTLGHTSVRITADIYTHVLPKTERDAVDRVDELFKEREAGE